MPKKLVSQAITKEEKKKNIKKFKRSTEELQQFKEIVQKLTDSFDQMNTPLEAFDGESLITTCQQNRLAGNSFLTPVENDGEVRVVTGTTEGKLDSVFNAVYNQNLEIDVRAYNEYDLQDFQLGDSLTKIVKRSTQIERDDDFWESVLREILTMPACYIQEIVDERWYYDRVLEKGEWEDLWQFKIPQFKKVGYMRRREPKKVLWTCEQVYLANIRLPLRLFQEQPYIITYRTRTWDEVQSVYKNSPRLEYIKPGAPENVNYKNIVDSTEWRFTRGLKDNEVEEIIYKSVVDDEYQVYLNGVNMLPVGCPFFATRMKTYDMCMVGGKEINPKFAYRRPLVSMTKVLQALKDETFRLLVLEARQSVWEPIVTKAKTILSKDMWLPAAITYGVDKSEIESLKSKGATGGNSIEVILNNMVESEIEKFINVSNIFQGISDGQKRTAHEIAQMMKQALIGLGTNLTGFIRAHRDASYLRLYNILENFIKPIDTRYNDFADDSEGKEDKSEDIFPTFSIDETDLYDGKVGTEIISLINRELLPAEKDKVIELEKKSRDEGNPVSYSFLSVDKLLKTKYIFFIDINITEKKSSLLEAEMAKKDIADSVAFASSIGARVNPEVAAQEWGKNVRRIDTKKFFVIPTAQPEMGAEGAEMPGMAPDGSVAPNVTAPGPKTPKTDQMGVKQLMQSDSMKSS